MKEVEKYLDSNFGQENSFIKRPKDYYYIQVSFRMEKLEIIIANTMHVTSEGIKTELDEVEANFCYREGGYKLGLGIADIAVNMFSRAGVEPFQHKAVLYKVVPVDSTISGHKYVKLDVVGNPLEKPHLNTEVKLVTSELMLVFYPKIVDVATKFVDLKFSKENKEAAIEKYGEIKDITTNAVSETIDKPTKAYVGADIFINSITIAVPFNPKQPDVNCWGLTLGSVHFLTDESTCKKKDFAEDEPMDIFTLDLKAFSFRHY
jgi:hypothetical protein